ncbi:MAG: MBL fold metallo-hydrolase [Litorimonas sp.]
MKALMDVHVINTGSCRHPEIMTRKDGKLKPINIPALAFLLVHPVEGPILFDTGYDPAFIEATRPLPERAYAIVTPVDIPLGRSAAKQLRTHGYEASDIRHVILSHFHGDHIAGLHAFPNANIHCSKSGLDKACGMGRVKGTRNGILKTLIPDDIHSRARFFEYGKEVSLAPDFIPFTTGIDLLGDTSILAIELPGHCPGHWGVVVREASGQYNFLVADAAWSSDALRKNVPPPWLTTAFLGETKTLRSTLWQLNQLATRNADILLSPSHCPEVAVKSWT